MKELSTRVSIGLVLIFAAASTRADSSPESTTLSAEQPTPTIDATDRTAPAAAPSAASSLSGATTHGEKSWIPRGYHYPLGGLSVGRDRTDLPKRTPLEQTWTTPATPYEPIYEIVKPQTPGPAQKSSAFPPPTVVTPVVPVTPTIITPANSSPTIITPANSAPPMITPVRPVVK